MKKHSLFFILLGILSVQLGFAQQKTITGTVTDENGVSLPGATAVTSLERSFPPRYAEKSEWYLQKKEGPLRLLIPKNKNLKQLFKNHSS